MKANVETKTFAATIGNVMVIYAWAVAQDYFKE